MFTVTRRYPFLKKFIIVLFTIPLMFAGGSLLGGAVQDQTIGAVGDLEIPRAEFTFQYQNAVENYRRNTGSEDITPDVNAFLVAEVKKTLLDSYLLKSSIGKKGIYATDTVVAQHIRNEPSLQEDGEFSLSLYYQLVSDPSYYKEQVRENANNLVLFEAFKALPIPQINKKLAALRQQEREVDSGFIYPSDYPKDNFNVTDEQINAYYEANLAEYSIDEHSVLEYFIFNTDDLINNVNVSEDDITNTYDAYISEIESNERRKISHIYTTSQDKIDALYQQLQQGGNFGELAQTESEDKGSAIADGELGIFANGDLPTALDDVAFAAPINVAQPPIKVDDGYSIIRVDKIISKEITPLEEIRDVIIQKAKNQTAIAELDKIIDQLSDMALEEIGTLKNMANLVRQSVIISLVYKEDLTKNSHPFNDENVIADTFDSVIIQDQENSHPIYIDDNTYMVVRSVRHQPNQIQSIDLVSQKINDKLLAYQLASTLYIEVDYIKNNKTASVVKDQTNVEYIKVLNKIDWKDTQTVALAQETFDSYGKDATFSAAIIEQIYSTPIVSLPSFIFIPEDEGLRVIRINSIKENPPQKEDFQVIETLLTNTRGHLSSNGYIDEIRDDYHYDFYNTPDFNPGQSPSQN